MQMTALQNRNETARRAKGRNAYYAGLCAEEQVADYYCRRGYSVERKRWRGRAGEIDLILRYGAQVVFVEVKKSSSLECAVERLSGSQMQRIMLAAEEYVCAKAEGYNTEMRIDVAAVGQHGEISIIENVTMNF